MADTGCQSCLPGLAAVCRPGLTSRDLIPVTMTMHAANNVGIPILGAVIIWFSGRDQGGNL